MKIFSLECGENVIKSLSNMLGSPASGVVFGLGALTYAKLKVYDLKTKKYQEKEFKGNLEVCSFIATVSKDDDNQTFLHPHIVITSSDFATVGGHLEEGVVGATFEAMFFESDQVVKREFNKEIGLNLIKK